MEIDKQIFEILQLYEYSMSIGKSFNYHDNCDQFLQLLLKRRELNACWVLREEKDKLVKKYSMPLGNSLEIALPSPQKHPQLTALKDVALLPYTKELQTFCPINIDEGYIAIYRLKEHGFLFLYSKKNNLSQKDLNQLLPVIKKFSVTLEACVTHNTQKKLLIQLEERNKDLNNYAHVVSHDLKSPLRNINTLNSWLRQDHKNVLEPGALQYLDLITDNIGKMEDLISGILEYSSLGLKDFNVSNVNLNKLLTDLLPHMYTPDHIHIELQPDFPNIQGNAHRFQQVFQNLISNAIKYNDKEDGFVSVGFHRIEEQLEFFVKDNGKGIDERYFKKIFEPFQKLENTKDSSGIGLSIVEKIVNAYEGKIRLESEVGKGTTFFFTLN